MPHIYVCVYIYKYMYIKHMSISTCIVAFANMDNIVLSITIHYKLSMCYYT